MTKRNLSVRKLAALTKLFLILCLLSVTLSPLGTYPALAVDSPNLVSPEDSATIEATDDTPLGIPVFEWEPVAGATKYRIQVSNSSGFSTKVIDATTEFTRYAPTITSMGDGPWYWQVRVKSPVASAYSSYRVFTKDWSCPATQPVLNSPSEGAVLDFYNYPSFSWEPVTGAVQYLFEISSSNTSFETNIKYNNSNTPIKTVRHQPSIKLANGTYYWRVTPKDLMNASGTPSEIRQFVTQYNAAPQLLEPADNAFPTFTPNFRWEAVVGAQYYQLAYATSSDFSTGVTTIGTENTSYTPPNPLPNDVNYFWHVKAISGASSTDWSATRTFRKQWYLKPQLLTPTDNFQFVRFPFFSWTPVAGASYYKIEFDDDFGFRSPKETGTTSNPFYTPSVYESILPAGELYYWRVTPYDKNNNQGSPSNSFSFRSNAINTAPELIYPYYYYPAQDYLNPQEDRTAALPVFLWHRLYSAVDGSVVAAKYIVTVGTDPNF